ncbi:hypothetical protein Y032_0262g570 [Ancylostoma ceylanicum]|uniref:Reverse transcriptase domain-containing protein n=1 Tax=Ancylostoma ceylanicum TaxID=53326 RepID=A0A016SAT5_9BILA|nr:hypothetical protein Y032_0262g570 [Ancylostoma ceylanicum]
MPRIERYNLKTDYPYLSRSPSCDLSAFQQSLEFINESAPDTSDILLLGDFNFPSLSWPSASSGKSHGCVSSKEFLQFCEEHSLQQLVSTPTHGAKILDLVLTNNCETVRNIEVLLPFSTSDHSLISFELNASFTHSPPLATYLDFRKANFSAIIEDLLKINWRVLFASAAIADECYNIYLAFGTKLYLTMSLSHPTNKISKSIPLKSVDLNKRFSKKLKRELALHQLAEEDKIARCQNQKILYNYINRRVKNRSHLGTIMKNDGSICETDKQKADTFPFFFQTVYKKNTKHDVSCRTFTSAKIDFIDTNSELLYRTLTAIGLTPVPTLMFNWFILHGGVPTMWRIGCVKPIFKKGCRMNVTNYKPIFLTSCTSKVLERIVCKQLYSYLISNKVVSSHQHGFLPKRSTVTPLMSTIPLWQRIADSRGYVTACFVDYSKAFDSVPLNPLFLKLEAYGIEGSLLKFLKSFLSHRKQYVVVGTSYSYCYTTPSGVPQGTRLGPLMFLLYINDLPECLPTGVCCSIYADDTKIYSVNDHQKIQEALKRSAEWSTQWGLTISLEKSSVMFIGSDPPRDQKLYLGNYELKAAPLALLGGGPSRQHSPVIEVFPYFFSKPADGWYKMTDIIHRSFLRSEAARPDTVLCLLKCLLCAK